MQASRFQRKAPSPRGYGSGITQEIPGERSLQWSLWGCLLHSPSLKGEQQKKAFSGFFPLSSHFSTKQEK